MSNANDFIIENGVLTKYVGPGGDVVIPDSVQKIGEKAFYQNKTILRVDLPEGLIDIGKYSFRQSSIVSIAFPKTLLHVEYAAFEACFDLVEVLFNEGLQSINAWAFRNCTSLSKIVIPKTVKLIEDDAFDISKEEKDCPAIHRSITINGKPKFEERTFGYSCRTRQVWCDYMRGKYPYEFMVADTIPLFTLLFEKENAWSSFLDSEKMQLCSSMFRNPDAYHKGDVAYWVKKVRAQKKEYLPYILKKTDIETFKGALSCGVVDVRNCEDAMEIVSDDAERRTLIMQMFKEHPVNLKKEDNTIGQETVLRAEEEEARELLKTVGNADDVKSAVSEGISFRDGQGSCSRELLTAILAVYENEWKRVCTTVRGEYSSIEVLRDGRRVQINDTVDRIASVLNPKELSAFLENLVSGPKYRLYLLAWARFADDESVARVTSDYRTRLQGKAKDRYYAENLAQAILINPTRTAVLFCDKNGLLERYAEVRGSNRKELLDSAMMPDLGFNVDGKKRFDIGGRTIEACFTDELRFELFDCEKGAVIRSFPKTSGDPEKAAAAAKEYKAFQKQVMDFVKLRSNLLLKMHMSGEYLSQESWRKTYLEHPVLRRLAGFLVWMDKEGNSFFLQDGEPKDASLNKVEPKGAICVAHVLQMKQNEVEAWQHCLTKLGRKQLFEQIWEPVYSGSIKISEDRYREVIISNKERNALKTALKRRGIDVSAGELEREYDPYTGTYSFGTENTMYFGHSASLDYKISDNSGDIILGGLWVATGKKANVREINAIILELDKVTGMARIKKDDVSVAGMLESFTLAQITEFIAVAQEANANNVLAVLLDYKNAHFADFDPMAEFTLDW